MRSITKITAAVCVSLLIATTAACGNGNSDAEASATADKGSSENITNTSEGGIDKSAVLTEADILGKSFKYGDVIIDFTNEQTGTLNYDGDKKTPVRKFTVTPTKDDDKSNEGDEKWRGYTLTKECVDSYENNTWKECAPDAMFLLTGATGTGGDVSQTDFQNAGFEVFKDGDGNVTLNLVSEGNGENSISNPESTAKIFTSMPKAFASESSIQLKNN
ncbi:hypothetical protein PG2114B_1632 [Bifidobacterium pseudolongum subsp. globosum]|uniref:hypothetical protein n=1 Tax=Bifidobacterium pseudolongum TaxID=1694 RepID=UPI00101FC184|nr:hypothetical protein [Bifidobacterium pseudolongum]RYQ03267.1 hypothetical protein PG2114B_1632 [Bifidobacterium pseudolongum subsp. globosum]